MEEKGKIVVVGDHTPKGEMINRLNQQTEVVQIDENKTTEVGVEELNMENLQKDAMKKYNEAKNQIVLPEVGTQISINGQIFQVTYVNEQKKRFSVEPVI